jgi:F0F1-type ATP synthase alpha subunit
MVSYSFESEEDNVGVVLLGPSTGIKEGSTAKEHNVFF